MAQPRSRRLRLLESLRCTINEMLHEKVQRAAMARGHGAPQNTQSIYTSAADEVPELLEQLLFVHRRVGQERGEKIPPVPPGSLDHGRRQAMLSAVRAAVKRSSAGFEG
jgi:hypothetical protein